MISVFTRLCNHHHYPISESFISRDFIIAPHSPLSPAPGKPLIDSLSLWISYWTKVLLIPNNNNNQSDLNSVNPGDTQTHRYTHPPPMKFLSGNTSPSLLICRTPSSKPFPCISEVIYLHLSYSRCKPSQPFPLLSKKPWHVLSGSCICRVMLM